MILNRSAIQFSTLCLVLTLSLVFAGPASGGQPTILDTEILGRPEAHEHNGSILAISANELNVGADLNGDGDADDQWVLHVHDIAAQTTVNLGLAAISSTDRTLVSGDHILYPVSEVAQGSTDLNGDGDAFDNNILHVYDHSTGSVMNLGVEVHLDDGLPVRDGNWYAFLVNEVAQDEDLNGDGDASDRQILHIYDVQNQRLVNIGFPAEVSSNISKTYQFQNGHLAFEVDELMQGADLNGDGRILRHHVLFVHDVPSGITTNLAVAVSDALLLPDRVYYTAPSGRLLWYEFIGGGVIHDTLISGIRLQIVSNLPTLPSRWNWIPVELSSADSHLAFYGVQSNEVISTGVRARALQMDDDRAVFSAGEGGSDQNGDGDGSDTILNLVQLNVPGLPIGGLGVAVEGFTLSGNTIFIDVDESDQGNMDLNGDGDTTDPFIVHSYDISSSRMTNLGVARDYGRVVHGNRIAFLTDFTPSRLQVYDADTGFLDDLGCVLRDYLDFEGDTLAFLSLDGVLQTYDATENIITTIGESPQARQETRLRNGVITFHDGSLSCHVVEIDLLSPSIVCGLVNADAGSPVDVLFVNGQSGIVTVPIDSPIGIVLNASPAGPASDAPYVFWAWQGGSRNQTPLNVDGESFGWMINPTPLHAAEPQPFLCLRSPNMPRALCRNTSEFDRAPSGAPWSISRNRGFGFPMVVTLQAILKDNGSPNLAPRNFSPTNSVTLVIE